MKRLARFVALPVLFVASLASADRLRTTDEEQAGAEMSTFLVSDRYPGLVVYTEGASTEDCGLLWDDMDAACERDEPSCEALAESYEADCAPPSEETAHEGEHASWFPYVDLFEVE